MNLKFQTNTARVKGMSFHPSRPWILISLHTGSMQIWDYNMKMIVAKFQDLECPVRGISFHHTLPLFVCGADDGNVRVYNYKQKRCLFTLKGHIDYVRTTFFHHQLPWILSACDDQTMRLWNYQSRCCVNIVTGHSHYVMCAQFHPQKNFIVSGSLDSTVRIWDFTVLKKKMTENKAFSSFVGIEIQCIKILQGHQRGVNWVSFHPTQNLVASSSDDRKIKLWKYTNQVAWEHTTLNGHSSNVSCVIFDPKTGNLVSNAEDKTIALWNVQNKNQIQVHKRQSGRYWIFAMKKNGSLLASGHDQGFQIFTLNKQKIPHVIIQNNLVIFAQGLKTFLYDVQKKVQKQELYQYNLKDSNAVAYIQRIIVNPFASTTFIVQINENNQRAFMIKKKQNYLNFPFVIRSFDALDSCFLSQTHIAVLQNPSQIHFVNYASKQQQKKTVLKLKQSMKISRIFSSDQENIFIFVTNNFIAKYDTRNNSIIGQQQIPNNLAIKSVSHSKQKIAFTSKYQLLVMDKQLNTICKIEQSFPIQSVFWQSQEILFYTTSNHWKYLLMNGESGVLRSIQQPLHLLKKLPQLKFLAFNQTKKILQISYPKDNEIEFKLAVNNKDWQKVRNILKNLGKNHKALISYLVSKGHANVALDLVDNPQEQFALAIQSTNFQKAFEICNKVNTIEYWKMLGNDALQQGIYEAYEVSCQKQKNYDKLNFLYSLQGNQEKLQKMLKLSKKMQNPMLGFNTCLLLNKPEQKQEILRQIGLSKLAQLTLEASKPINEHSDLLKKLGSKPLTICQIEEQDFSNWPHTVVQEDED